MLIRFICLALIASSVRCCIEERLSVNSINSIESSDKLVNSKSHHNSTQLASSDASRASDSIDTSASEINEISSNSTANATNSTKVLLSNGMTFALIACGQLLKLKLLIASLIRLFSFFHRDHRKATDLLLRNLGCLQARRR